MATSWVRLWTDMPNDPKWRTIAKASGQTISTVMAIYVHMLTCAANATERGRTQGWSDEDIASALDLRTDDVVAVREAMQGRVLDGDYLSGWERRQPLREDGSASRAKAWREAKKEANANATERDQTKQNAEKRPDTDTDTDNRTTTSSSGDDLGNCPINEIVDLYHRHLPNNPKVKSLNKARRGAIQQRWREGSALTCRPFGYKSRSEGLEAWQRFFEICAGSEFLTGRARAQPGKPPFVADIDFLFSPAGFTKTIENKYHREAA